MSKTTEIWTEIFDGLLIPPLVDLIESYLPSCDVQLLDWCKLEAILVVYRDWFDGDVYMVIPPGDTAHILSKHCILGTFALDQAALTGLPREAYFKYNGIRLTCDTKDIPMRLK